MRTLAAALVLVAPALAAGVEPAWTLRADSVAELRAALLEGAAERLSGKGWQLVPESARVVSSQPWPSGAVWTVRPRWTVEGGRLRLPLAFDLEAPGAGAEEPIRLSAWLTATLRREVLTMRRSVRSGDAVVCDDTVVALRPLDAVPAGTLTGRCELGDGATARRPLGTGDLLRAADVGLAPSVAARSDVRLRVQVGPVTVEKPGTALSDGRDGESVLVRLAGSAQAVRGVVVGRNLVEVGAEP